MKRFIFLLLLILSLAALLQPLIYFYIYHGDFAFLGFSMLCCFSNLGLLVANFIVKKMPRAFVWWGLIIFCTGLFTAFIPQQWLYTADGLLLMAQREKIVERIKVEAITDSIYHPEVYLPVSIRNWIKIETNQGVYSAIEFPTRDVSFVHIYWQGVLYSELPERQIAYHRTSELGGITTEYRLKLRKIKAQWYFYTYESSVLHD